MPKNLPLRLQLSLPAHVIFSFLRESFSFFSVLFLAARAFGQDGRAAGLLAEGGGFAPTDGPAASFFFPVSGDPGDDLLS